ncbi:hypothetical protein [Paenirhodobacter populi]|uniref:Uncharacterized protein n=1 Tax=Paenirhodobacter populi TaxID=2306993 RepID=A0A443JR43_9RHOB|nr:hypothetical protein [Sinirhodobacter populi]RWR22956.1 hypothetical protein D2T30_04835 [Sinirhodobacter populi]
MTGDLSPSREDLRHARLREPGETGTWADKARAVIREVHARLPQGIGLDARIAALDAAYPFEKRCHYPYRVWCRERRNYLTRFAPVSCISAQPSTGGEGISREA